MVVWSMTAFKEILESRKKNCKPSFLTKKNYKATESTKSLIQQMWHCDTLQKSTRTLATSIQSKGSVFYKHKDLAYNIYLFFWLITIFCNVYVLT